MSARVTGPRTRYQAPRPASAKQVAFLIKLVNERGPRAKSVVDARLAATGLRHPSQLTMTEISRLIDTVKDHQPQRPAATVRLRGGSSVSILSFDQFLEANEFFDGEFSPAQERQAYDAYLKNQAAKVEAEQERQAYRSKPDYRSPRPDFTKVPESQYALEDADGRLEFFRVTVGQDGTRWEGFRFVEKLIGAPGNWRTVRMMGAQAAAILSKIASDSYTDPHPQAAIRDLTGPRAGQVRFSRTHKRCAVCSSPLSDDKNRGKDGLTSVERGIGPVCASR